MVERGGVHYGNVTLYNSRNIANKYFSIFSISKKSKENMIGFIFAIEDSSHEVN